MIPVVLVVYVESKEEFAGGMGRLPSPGDVERHLGDILADATRSDWELPWRAVSVREEA